MLFFASTYFVVLTLSTLFTLIIQFVSLYCMVKFSPKNMLRYRTYLILSTVYDVIYTFVIGILMQGSPTGPENDPTIMFTGLIVMLFKEEGTRIGMVLFYSSFALVSAGQTICLLYRFLVFHTKRKKIFDAVFAKRSIALIHILVYLLIILLAIFGALGISLKAQETNFGTVGVYLDSQNRKTDTSKFVILTITLLILWEASYFLIVARIMQLLKPKIATFSPNTIRLHRQLSYLLLAQAISPLICMILPVMLAGLDRIISDTCFGYARIQASFLMSTAQMAINSILTITFIAPYRSKLKKTIKKMLICMRIQAIVGDQSRDVPVISVTNTQSQTI